MTRDACVLVALLALLPLPGYAAPADTPDASGDQTLGGFNPPPCVPPGPFSDVPHQDPFCPWIQQLVTDQITSGCGGANYCPNAPVTRAQMAVFLELAMRGTPGWSPIPTGAVMFFNLAACPPGWTELTAARGRYPVGLQSGGTLAGTSGAALTDLEDRPAGQHDHPTPALTEQDRQRSSNGSVADDGDIEDVGACVTAGHGWLQSQ